MTINDSMVEKLKTNMVLPYQMVNDLNLMRVNLAATITDSFKSIAENTNSLKAIVDMSTDQEVSSGPNKLTLDKIPVQEQNGLFVSNGRIKQLPRILNEVKPIDVSISGNGSSYITIDESGEEIQTPKVFFSEDIKNGLEFQYQNNGMSILSIEFSFKAEERISIINIDVGNSYGGSQTLVNSIYINNGVGVRFTTIKTDSSIILILEEEIVPTSLTVNLSSSAYVKNDNVSLLRFKKISFGILGFEEISTITFGPIGSNNLGIIKAGISVDKTVKNISFKVSPDNTSWYDFDIENEKGYSISFNTIFSRSKSIKTNKIYISVSVKNTKIDKEISNIVFEKYAGEDCFDTTLMFGGSLISNQIIPEFSQSTYSIQEERYVTTEEVDPTKNYRVSLIPFNPVLPNNIFEEKYGAKIVLDPNNSIVNVYGPVMEANTLNNNTNFHFIYKRKPDYIPGKYSYVINGETKKSFDVYGDYDFSLSRYIMRVLKTDTVVIRLENELGTINIDLSKVASFNISETENLINIAKIFTVNNTNYMPSFFYPFTYNENESITENGTDIQNGLYAIPFVSTSYIKNKTSELSIRDIGNYSSLMRVNETDTLDRVKTYKAKHKKISNISIKSDTKNERVQFIDGKKEFIEKKIYSVQDTVSDSKVVISDILINNKVEVYTSGYAKKLFRVYSKNDIISIYNFYVENGVLFFSKDINNEILNITYESYGNGKIIPDIYSVDQESGVVYFSSYQNNIIIKYEFIDIGITTNMYTSKNISSEGVHESIGISEVTKTISNFSIEPIPVINIGVVYE